MRTIFQLLITVILLCYNAEHVTAQFTFQGKIDYERKVNMHSQIDDWTDGEEDNSWAASFKKKVPKFATYHFSMVFNRKQSAYTPVKQEEDPALAMMGGQPGVDNQVWNNYETGTMTAFKKVYEQSFLIADTMKQIKWKILDEVRSIAGYSCRKAVCRIHDSVVVVAFYTDQIPVSGGPELFGGLPGMILQIVIPRMSATWIAVNVVAEEVKPGSFAAIPAKGKKVTLKEVEKAVRSGTKDWGKFADKSIWWSAL